MPTDDTPPYKTDTLNFNPDSSMVYKFDKTNQLFRYKLKNNELVFSKIEKWEYSSGVINIYQNFVNNNVNWKIVKLNKDILLICLNTRGGFLCKQYLNKQYNNENK